MNKRQAKKLRKKFGKRKYIDVRLEKIYKVVQKNIKTGSKNEYGFPLLHIVDSRRMDLKHPVKVELFLNCYPSSMSSL